MASRIAEGIDVQLDGPRWEWDIARARCLREARRILRDREDAEEAVQEALIRAWRNQAKCRTPATPIPWLVQITRNEALRLAARRQRRQASEVPEETPDRLLASDDGLDEMLASLATEQALAALCPEERTLLRLRYEEDLTQGQVAARLGVPEGTVKVRLHRVRARLRGVAADLAA
ncbi:MAG TPA: sigma-70 family RNA polymerase sigma factor [Thermoleophilaceae bacterium]